MQTGAAPGTTVVALGWVVVGAALDPDVQDASPRHPAATRNSTRIAWFIGSSCREATFL